MSRKPSKPASSPSVAVVAWYVALYLRGVAAPAHVLMQSREHALATVGWLSVTFLKYAPEDRKGCWIVSRDNADKPHLTEQGVVNETEVLGCYEARSIVGAHAVVRAMRAYED